MYELTPMEKLEEEIMDLGLTVRGKDVEIRLLNLKLRKIKFIVSCSSKKDCKLKEKIMDIIDEDL